jgi:predicted nucleic acid-binding protein
VGLRLLDAGEIHVPHLVTIETTSVIRGWSVGGWLEPRTARRALIDLTSFKAVRHHHDPYLQRVWELRHNLTAYDALYVALAETLDVPLLTCDARLARAPLTSVTIELVGPSS